MRPILSKVLPFFLTASPLRIDIINYEYFICFLPNSWKNPHWFFSWKAYSHRGRSGDYSCLSFGKDWNNSGLPYSQHLVKRKRWSSFKKTHFKAYYWNSKCRAWMGYRCWINFGNNPNLSGHCDVCRSHSDGDDQGHRSRSQRLPDEAYFLWNFKIQMPPTLCLTAGKCPLSVVGIFRPKKSPFLYLLLNQQGH